MSSCGCTALAARGDPKGPTAGVSGLGRKARGKRRTNGKFCVVSKSGRTVGCYAKASTAKKVARGFGPGFRVR